MSDDTFTASDFSTAEASISSEPVAASPEVSESSAPVETTAQPDGATTQPAAITTDQPSTEPAKAGPIPFDVHKTALDNARSKAVAEYQQRYGWAEQVNQQDMQEAIRIAQLSQRDPIAYLQDFVKDLQNHPTYGAQLKSLHARALAAARGQAASEQEPQPDLPIQLEDGRVVHLYSAEQQAKRESFLQQQWMNGVRQELQPLRATHEQLQAERQAIAREHEITQYVASTYQDVTTWPGMQEKANQVAVANALSRMQVNADDPREVSLALNTAYRQVVIPTLHTAERRAVLNDITRQANANTVNPAHSSTRAPKSMDEMSIAEALHHVAAQQA